MRRLGWIAGGALLGACGGATPAPRVSEPSCHTAAVASRLAQLPPPPLPWETPVVEVTDEHVALLCPYIAENVGLTQPSVTCPNGTTIEATEYECSPDTAGAFARSLPCAVTVGELLACLVAMREHPCTTDLSALDECRAFSACSCDAASSP